MPFLTDLLLLLLDRKVYGLQGCVVAIAYLASIHPEKQKAKSKKTDVSFQSIFQAQMIETQLKVL